MDKAILQAFFMEYASAEQGEVISAAVVKSEMRLLTLVNKVVHEDPDFMSVHFDKIIGRFGHDAKALMKGLMAMRTDLTKQQHKEVMDKFLAKLPAADQASLLQQQLVAQNVAAMASPKAGDKKKNGEDGASTKSFWDHFKSRDKKPEKAKPSAALHKKSEEEGQSMADFLEK